MSISAGYAKAGLPDGVAAALMGSAVLGQDGATGSIFPGFSSKPTPPADPFLARGTAQSPDANGATRLPPTGPASCRRRRRTMAMRARATPGHPVLWVRRPTPPHHRPAVCRQVPTRAPTVQVNRADMPRPPLETGPAATPSCDQPAWPWPRGDVHRAADMVLQGQAGADSLCTQQRLPRPGRTAIAKYEEVKRLDRSQEENRKVYARMLMEQAEALLQWGELEQADKLAVLAAEQPAAYGPFDPKPTDLVKRIAALRQQNSPAAPRPIDNRYTGGNALGPSIAGRQQAVELMRQVRGALAAGQTDRAVDLCRQLDALRIPENAFGPGKDRPGLVFDDVHRAMGRNASGVIQAGVIQAGGVNPPNPGVQSLVYDPSRDSTDNVQVGQQGETIASLEFNPAVRWRRNSGQSLGYSLFQQGVAALKDRNRDRALQLFQQASAYMNDLDPPTAARLRITSRCSSVPRPANGYPAPPARPATPIDEAVAAQLVLLRQVLADVNHCEADATRMLEKDPKTALATLQEMRKKVESAGLEPDKRDQLLRRLDRRIADTQRYIEQNRSRIDLEAKNDNVWRDLVQPTRSCKCSRNWPNWSTSTTGSSRSSVSRRRRSLPNGARGACPARNGYQSYGDQDQDAAQFDRDQRIRDRKEEAWVDAMHDVDESVIATSEPYSMPDARHWREMSDRRHQRAMETNRRHRSEKELDIEKKLLTPVNYSAATSP